MVPEFNIYDISKFNALDTSLLYENEIALHAEGEEINIVEHFTPWQESFISDYNKYCEGLKSSTDSYILEFYAHEFPDYAMPILRKGCDYSLFKRLYDIEDEYNAVGLCAWPDMFNHVYGLYYVDKLDNNTEERYCLKCFRDDISNCPDDVIVHEYHCAIQDEYEVLSELNYNINNNHYWCHGCNKFLYNIEDGDYYNPIQCGFCSQYYNKYSILDRVVTDYTRQVNHSTFPEIDVQWPMIE